MNQELLQELKDIKPILDVPDSSIYLFFGLLSLFIIVLIWFFWLIYKSFFRKKEPNLKALYFKRLKELNFDNSKEAAYEITKLGAIFCDEPNTKEVYEKLKAMLEVYKYKKSVPQMDEKVKMEFKHFLELIKSSV